MSGCRAQCCGIAMMWFVIRTVEQRRRLQTVQLENGRRVAHDR